MPDIAIDLRETQYAGHAQHITAGTNMAGYDALLSIGGDGTAHEVVNGMLLGVVLGVHPPHALPALCIVPCGSGNTVAYSIGYQTHEEAVQRLLARTTRALDVVELAHAPPTPQAGAEWLAAVMPPATSPPATAPTAPDGSAAGEGLSAPSTPPSVLVGSGETAGVLATAGEDEPPPAGAPRSPRFRGAKQDSGAQVARATGSGDLGPLASAAASGLATCSSPGQPSGEGGGTAQRQASYDGATGDHATETKVYGEDEGGAFSWKLSLLTHLAAGRQAAAMAGEAGPTERDAAQAPTPAVAASGGAAAVAEGAPGPDEEAAAAATASPAPETAQTDRAVTPKDVEAAPAVTPHGLPATPWACPGLPEGADVDSLSSHLVFSLNMVGYGLAPTIVRIADDCRAVCGTAPYTLAAATQIAYRPSFRAKVVLQQACEVEGLPDHSAPVPVPGTGNKALSGELEVPGGEFIMLQMQNTIHCGDKTPFCPNAAVDDGFLDVATIHRAPRCQLAATLKESEGIAGEHVLRPFVRQWQARQALVYPAEGVNAALPGCCNCCCACCSDGVHAPRGPGSLNVDGEDTGFTPARVTIVPAALRVFA